jgi:hypothetical protein
MKQQITRGKLANPQFGREIYAPDDSRCLCLPETDYRLAVFNWAAAIIGSEPNPHQQLCGEEATTMPRSSHERIGCCLRRSTEQLALADGRRYRRCTFGFQPPQPAFTSAAVRSMLENQLSIASDACWLPSVPSNRHWVDWIRIKHPVETRS